VLHAQAMGAEVVTTRSDVGKGHADYYQDLAEAIARRTPGAIFINQFANPANPRAHETSTGPEMLGQMDGDIDAVVVGVGSGGMLSGIGRFMRAVYTVPMCRAGALACSQRRLVNTCSVRSRAPCDRFSDGAIMRA
jgi:cysteine synthase